MTITLDVPQDLAQELRRVPLEEVTRFVIAAIRHEFSSTKDNAELLSLSEADYAAIEDGLDDVDEGRVHDVEEAFALLRRERDTKQ